jgi:hypothetical protein
MDFATFLEAAWNDHGDRPEDVAARLAGGVGLVAAPADIAPFARIVTHVYGEHLGRWDDGVRVLESLRASPACDGSAAATGAIAVGIATLRYAGGDRDVAAALEPEDRIAVLAAAASALVGRGDRKLAGAAYRQALVLAEAGLPPGSPAIRALAVGGNNLAATLEETADRDADDSATMVAAAEAGLRYWRLAGTWLEEERALYRVARSRMLAGDPEGASDSAQACLDVCAINDASPFERFFGYAMLALARRAAGDKAGFATARAEALRLHARIAAEEQPWCRSELAALGA